MSEPPWTAQTGLAAADADDNLGPCALVAQLDADIRTLDTSPSLGTFTQWAQTVFRQRVPHQRAIFGMAARHSLGFDIQQLIPLDMPGAFLDAIRGTAGTITCPVVYDWFRLRRLQQFDAEQPGAHDQTPWLSAFRRHGFRTQIVHGHATDDGQVVSFVSLYAGHTVPPAALPMLEIYVPAVTACLLRLLHNLAPASTADKPVALTRREMEIIDWIAKGKTNWEIGQILGISELTVKSHVQRLFFKTGTNTRTQLAARALSLRHKW